MKAAVRRSLIPGYRPRLLVQQRGTGRRFGGVSPLHCEQCDRRRLGIRKRQVKTSEFDRRHRRVRPSGQASHAGQPNLRGRGDAQGT